MPSKYRATAFAIAAALAVLFPASAFAQLSGEQRDQFVNGSIASCSQRAHMAHPDVPLPTVTAYCTCMANKEADITTADDIAYMTEHKAATEEYRQKVLALAPACNVEVGLSPPVKAPVKPGAPPPGGAGSQAKQEIPLTKQGDSYLVPIAVNAHAAIGFVIDTNASDITLPGDTVFNLWKTGALQSPDFVGAKVYALPDGRKLPSSTFKIRRLKLGSVTIRDVVASVGAGADPVVGGGILSRFGTWSVDNDRNVLMLSR